MNHTVHDSRDLRGSDLRLELLDVGKGYRVRLLDAYHDIETFGEVLLSESDHAHPLSALHHAVGVLEHAKQEVLEMIKRCDS